MLFVQVALFVQVVLSVQLGLAPGFGRRRVDIGILNLPEVAVKDPQICVRLARAGDLAALEVNRRCGLIIMGNRPDYLAKDSDIYYTGLIPHETCLEIFAASDWMIHLAWLDRVWHKCFQILAEWPQFC